MHNNNNNNVTINARVNSTQACAACKYQRRKCPPDCILAPYFPHDRQRQFLNAHKLFGVSNITKIIKNLDQPEKDAAMRTIIFQSDVRANDPVGGCYRIVMDLQRQIDYAKAELEIVLHQLAVCRAQAHMTRSAAQQHNTLHAFLQDEGIDCNINCDIFGVDTFNSQQEFISYQQQIQCQNDDDDDRGNAGQFDNNSNNDNMLHLQQEVCDSWGMQGSSSISPCVEVLDPAPAATTTDDHGVQLTKQPSITESNDYKPFAEFGFDSDETIDQRTQADGACIDGAGLKEDDESFRWSQDHNQDIDKSVGANTLFNTFLPLEGGYLNN